MKVTGLFFSWSAVLYYVIATIYWVVSRDQIGTTALALTGGLATIVGFYMIYTARRVGSLPEDRPNAEIHEADADYGFFPPHSWWPLPVALFAAITAVGLVITPWLLVLGAVGLVLSIVGFVFEFYRGTDLT